MYKFGQVIFVKTHFCQLSRKLFNDLEVPISCKNCPLSRLCGLASTTRGPEGHRSRVISTVGHPCWLWDSHPTPAPHKLWIPCTRNSEVACCLLCNSRPALPIPDNGGWIILFPVMSKNQSSSSFLGYFIHPSAPYSFLISTATLLSLLIILYTRISLFDLLHGF